MRTLIARLVELLEEKQKEEYVKELKSEHGWCGIHNKPLQGTTPYQYALAQSQGVSSLFGSIGGTLGGLIGGTASGTALTTNTVPSNTYTMTYGAPFVCPECVKGKEDRRKELLRRLGHEW